MARWFVIVMLLLAVVCTSARDMPTVNNMPTTAATISAKNNPSGLNDKKNFITYGGVGGFAGLGSNGLPVGGFGGLGGVTGLSGTGGGLGGLGGVVGGGGGAAGGVGGTTGGGSGVLPNP